MEQQQTPPTAIQEEEQVQPTRTVQTFWERLDEVFNQNKDLRARMEELVEQFPSEVRPPQQYQSFIFQPSRVLVSSNDDITAAPYTTIRDPVQTSQTQGHAPAERFNSFRVRLRRPLRNVKSIQLLSGVIPNAVQSIPDEQVFFLYYKLRSVAQANLGAWDSNAFYEMGDIVSNGGFTWASIKTKIGNSPNSAQPGLSYWIPYVPTATETISAWSVSTAYIIGDKVQINNLLYQCQVANTGIEPGANYWIQTTLPADTTRPNYYDLNYLKINYIYLTPTYWYSYDYLPNVANDQQFFNRRFEDYQDLVDALNFISSQNQQNNVVTNDVTFQYDEKLNKIIFVPNPTAIANHSYYLPCGYADPNVQTFLFSDLLVFTMNGDAIQLNNFYTPSPQTILNTRLGYTWNGLFENPQQMNNPWGNTLFLSGLFWYLRSQDPGYNVITYPVEKNQLTFNSYADLVNTSCVRVYADFTFTSTEDSLGSSVPDTQNVDGLLSLVPINATNLGVSYYQNNFNNPLTKIPDNITQIGITMLNDQGLPFYLPNSGVVLLELAIEYK